MRKSIWRKYKLSLQTDDFIKEITTITITTVATAVTPYIIITDRNHIALYIIRKDIAHENILKRSKKSPRLNLKISLRTASRSK
jgi:autonomous glycyl radical cofactor GrcA